MGLNELEEILNGFISKLGNTCPKSVKTSLSLIEKHKDKLTKHRKKRIGNVLGKSINELVELGHSNWLLFHKEKLNDLVDSLIRQSEEFENIEIDTVHIYSKMEKLMDSEELCIRFEERRRLKPIFNEDKLTESEAQLVEGPLNKFIKMSFGGHANDFDSCKSPLDFEKYWKEKARMLTGWEYPGYKDMVLCNNLDRLNRSAIEEYYNIILFINKDYFKHVKQWGNERWGEIKKGHLKDILLGILVTVDKFNFYGDYPLFKEGWNDPNPLSEELKKNYKNINAGRAIVDFIKSLPSKERVPIFNYKGELIYPK